MAIDDLDRLAALIKRESNALLAEWRQQVRQLPSAQHLDTPTLNDHVPRLIDELAAALKARSDETIPEALAGASPPDHGVQRLEDGFDIEEVVAEYNILRGCVHNLANANGLTLQGKPFHILNRVLDGAIGMAVQSYATRQALEVQKRREEYLAFVAHDLRTPLNAISLATRFLERTLGERGGGSNEGLTPSRPSKEWPPLGITRWSPLGRCRSASSGCEGGVTGSHCPVSRRAGVRATTGSANPAGGAMRGQISQAPRCCRRR